MRTLPPVWEHQDQLAPVGTSVNVDASALFAWADALGIAPHVVEEAVTKAVQDRGRAWYARWFFLVSGDEFAAAHLSQRGYDNLNVFHPMSGTVLNVRTGRLRGSMVQTLRPMMYEAVSHLFYLSLWETGIPGFMAWGKWPKPQEARPTAGPALEYIGGPEAVSSEVNMQAMASLRSALDGRTA
jgi:hypothetical protein